MPTSELVAAPPAISITPYRAQDAQALVLSAHAAASFQHVPNLEAIWQQYETAGPAWTLRVEDTIVGCAGLMLLWPGRAHAWMLPGATLAQYPRTAVTALLTHLRGLTEALGLVRIQCDVMADFTMGRRLVEWLGFVPEGPPMLRYGPNDEDYQRYAMIAPREAPHVD